MVMDLVNEKVMHKTFGEGDVIALNDLYIKINFKTGDKKFVFPDVFKNYITFIDQNATDIVNKKIVEREEERKVEEVVLKKEKALAREKQAILNQRERMKNVKVHPNIQSVFWCDPEEEEEIFRDWKVFTGKIKSGDKKGEPRRFPRMNQNSACLLTRMKDNMSEENRQILGVFMASEFFDGKVCEDGYIVAHPKYRLRLSEEESGKMLFWNYYVDEKSCNKTRWNSGRQRYFDNVWMAQILRDIVALRGKPEEKKEAKAFFEHFCKVNFIDKNQLGKAKGVLSHA